jgi:hypothetical protein
VCPWPVSPHTPTAQRQSARHAAMHASAEATLGVPKSNPPVQSVWLNSVHFAAAAAVPTGCGCGGDADLWGGGCGANVHFGERSAAPDTTGGESPGYAMMVRPESAGVMDMVALSRWVVCPPRSATVHAPPKPRHFNTPAATVHNGAANVPAAPSLHDVLPGSTTNSFGEAVSPH